VVGYNQNMPDVWGSFASGMEVGGALRRRQQQDQYGQAYQQGGWEAVGDAAGGQGDLQTAEGAQAVASQQEENMRDAALANAAVLQRVHRSLSGLDEATRRERLTQMAPQLSQYGPDENTLSGLDTSDAGWATLGQSLEAAIGQLQEYEQVLNLGNGRSIGLRRDGTQVVISEGNQPWLTNGTRPYRVNQETGAVELGQGEIPVRPTGSAGQAPQRPVTPEEAEAWGIGDPAGWAIRDGEAPTRVGGTAGSRGDPLERAQATADVKRLEELNAQADTDMSTVAALDRFSALNAQTETNPTNPQAIGIGSWRPFADENTQQMVQVISQLTPQQRVPGSGATSDFDARMFTDALPGINRSRVANEAIIGAYRARGQLSRERAEFAADWLDQEGNLRQFDAEWRRYVEANPIFDRQSTPDNPILNTRRQDFATWYAQRSSGQGQTDAPRPGIAGAAAQVTGQPRSNEGRVRVWNRQTGRSE
jgi:hypothetical protein